MTRLASIASNHLALSCDLCGHSAEVPVTALIEVFGSEATVHRAAGGARCSRCKAKGYTSFRIIYVGEGWDALQGARGKSHA